MTDWNKLKVVDLKAELAKRGLPQTGLKAALVARLVEADDQDGSESEATIQDDARNDVSQAASPDTVASGAIPQSNPSKAILPEEPVEQQHSVNSQYDEEEENAQAISVPDIAKDTSDHVHEHNAPSDNNIATESHDRVLESQSTVGQIRKQSNVVESETPALPGVESNGTVEDRLKRKRRSQSPPPISEDVARKRFKTLEVDETQDAVITTEADREWVQNHSAIDEREVNAGSIEVASTDGVQPGPTIVDSSKEEVIVDSLIDDGGRRQSSSLLNSPQKPRDSRFTGLFVQPSNRQDSPEAVELEIDRVIEPAIHPATSALYIKNLMRPLQGPLLQSHLAMLATAPGHDTDPDVIVNFYLDPIKTHAFVIFKTTSAAARVRSAFHDRVWPDEKNRKQLWVDFIPAEKAEDWIAEEMATNNGPRSQKKWEVDYRFDENRQVTAVLQEAIASRPIQPVRQPVGPSGQATSSRGFDPPSGPRGFAHPPLRPAMTIAKLNELFESTTTKPVLYFQPVSKELANKRLDNIDSALSKDAIASRRLAGEIHRYTFENGDQLVDRGPEIFSGIRPPPSSRGARGGRGGLPQYRESYHGRDGRRDGGYGDRRYGNYSDDRRDRRHDRRY